MPFQPANDEHAVVECKFAIGFDTPFNARVLNHVHSKRGAWTERLPAQGISEMDISESVVQVLQGPTSRALYYATLRPDGSPVWSARCGFNEILITCTRYTRWTPTWQVAREMLLELAGAVADLEDKEISNITLHVEDVFLCRDNSYIVDDVLKRGSWISDSVLNKGQVWHCNSGWFEPVNLGLALNQLNVAVSGYAGDFNLRIVHQQQVRIEEGFGPRLLDLPTVADVVENSMNAMHLSNKAMLASLLDDRLAAAVKLYGGVE